MTTPVPTAAQSAGSPAAPAGPPKSRDADNTRRLLLAAARRRFAHDGYTATTVRTIATDAGVNTALINRYFDSKEGLFEACIRNVGEQLERPAGGRTVEQTVARMIEQLTGPDTGERSLQLMLLMRSSGDEHADLIRQNILRSFAEGIARIAGWSPDRPDDGQLLLRAQLAVATALGITMLRNSSGFEPLAGATTEDLAAALAPSLTTLIGGE
ncbi:AcrR family transcriptional regulator [Conyzicola lurida]|uniref:AcrR family transcriptional regulator n=1 Tax=Conyzicola lurida TaxID=1172621 RepID=A0A841ARZ5_9MICO|nr:TetR/AcrR family transcriptional regulator [Conyzicola lurida]MBB5844343.1 AcrR family transcriptional regulator [Conyzicola lurida]